MKTEYTISQIAEKLHITTNKIRFYEKKGLLTPMRESQNRYRKFGERGYFPFGDDSALSLVGIEY